MTKTKFKIKNAELIEEISGEAQNFPKYTTQLINIANQNAKGTIPAMVGQLSELIQECPHKNYEKWKEWYLNKNPEAIDRATDKIIPMIENLKEAIEGEFYEFTKMYPDFIEDSKKEGNKSAQRTFDYANAVEKIHHNLYEKALEMVEGGKDLEKTELYVCPVCGYTQPVSGRSVLPEKCPVCGVSSEKFKKIE